jgi:hypothetical protein
MPCDLLFQAYIFYECVKGQMGFDFCCTQTRDGFSNGAMNQLL